MFYLPFAGLASQFNPLPLAPESLGIAMLSRYR